MNSSSISLQKIETPSYTQQEEVERKKREEATFNPPAYFKNYVQMIHGNQQGPYNQASYQIVTKKAEALKVDIQAKKDPTLILRNLLEDLSEERKGLAKKLGSIDADDFGCWMDRNGSDTFFCTNLIDEHYQAYGNRILANIQTRLKQIIKEKGEDSRNHLWKGWGDDKSRFYVKVLTAEEILEISSLERDQHLEKSKIQQHCTRRYTKPLIESSDGIKICFEDIGKGLYMINDAYPSAATLQRELFPLEAHNKKTAYVLSVVVMKIEGIWRTMSGYLTWVYENKPNELTSAVIDQMSDHFVQYHENRIYQRKKSQVMLLHSCTNEKIEAVIRHTSTLFAQVIAWDRKDLAQLNRWIDEIDYTLIQLNPWFRGGAAIVKWLDAIMHKVHDLELVAYHPQKQMDLEIHATPYVPNYLKNHADNYPCKQKE